MVGAEYSVYMGLRRHGLEVDSPFLVSGPVLMLLCVIADDGVDDETPISLKLRAQAAEEFQNVRVESHAGGNLGLNHE